MCKGMNRSIINVILGGFGGETASAAMSMGDRAVTQGSADDASFIMKNAPSVIIVRRYVMAVAQAHHDLPVMSHPPPDEAVTANYPLHPVHRRPRRPPQSPRRRAH